MSSPREFQFALRRAFSSSPPLLLARGTDRMVTHSLSANLFPIEIPIFKLNSSPLDSTRLLSTLRENGQSAGAPSPSSFLPSILPSLPSLPCPLHPSSVLTVSSASSSAPLLPSFQLTFGGNNCFHFIPFVRPFVRSFKVLFPFLSTATDGETDRLTDRPTFPSSSSPLPLRRATKSLHSTSFSSKGFLLEELGKEEEDEGGRGGGGNPRT